MAVFACKFSDRTGTLSDSDATPMFKYTNPISSLNSEDMKKVKANSTLLAITDALYGSRDEVFVRLKVIGKMLMIFFSIH